MTFDRTKVVAAFLAESEEGLERTEQYLIAAETDPGNLELLDEMFRIAHTIKGKGVSFMENNPKFHGTAPTPAEVKLALQELQ